MLRAVPLPVEVTKLLDLHPEELKILHSIDVAFREKFSRTHSDKDIKADEKQDASQIKAEALDKLRQLHKSIKNAFELTGKRTWSSACENIWSIGPRHNGCNLLVNNVKDYHRPSIWSALIEQDDGLDDRVYREFDQSIVSGFQPATLAGPLCEEPMQGVAYIVEEWNLSAVTEEGCKEGDNHYG